MLLCALGEHPSSGITEQTLNLHFQLLLLLFAIFTCFANFQLTPPTYETNNLSAVEHFCTGRVELCVTVQRSTTLLWLCV